MTTSSHDVPPPVQLLQLIAGKWVEQAIYAVAELGVADHMKEGPKTSAALAAETQSDAASLHRLLRALASLGLFKEDAQGRFELTPVGAMLRSDVPGSMRKFAQMVGMPCAWRAWGEILHGVKTGRSPFEHVHGESGFEYLSKHPEEASLFDGAMSSFSAGVIPAVVAAYDFSQFGNIVDVAGGRGHLLAAILKANPRTQGILFDMPHVTDGARRHLEAEGVASRAQVISGDFLQSVPGGGDAYVLKHIIHDWDDARAETILRSCRQVVPKNGKLLVLEMVIPPGNDPFFGKLLDLEMLVMTPGGRERTESEYRSLIARAGFKLTGIIPTHSPVSLLEASPA